MGKISSIVYRPAQVAAHPDDHYSRVALQSANLLENYGIEGDCKGGHPKRQLNIMSHETLEALSAEGFKAKPGEMGEQIVISEMDEDLNSLPEGTQLQIGSEVIIELLEPRTGCDRFEAIQGISPSHAAGRLGKMARVVKSGPVQIGDIVTILDHV